MCCFYRFRRSPGDPQWLVLSALELEWFRLFRGLNGQCTSTTWLDLLRHQQHVPKAWFGPWRAFLRNAMNTYEYHACFPVAVPSPRKMARSHKPKINIQQSVGNKKLRISLCRAHCANITIKKHTLDTTLIIPNLFVTITFYQPD